MLAIYSSGLKLFILMLLIRVHNIVLSVNTILCFAMIILLACYVIGVCINRGLSFAHMQ